MTEASHKAVNLIEEQASIESGPVTCLGMEFANDAARRAYFTERLREHLQDPAFRAIEGFPIGEDEAILALSDPPYYTACPNPFLPQIIEEWQQERQVRHESLGLADDLYHREPFATDVSEGKNDPIYNAHSYHTKVPHKAIMRYILHYTEPGDIVFDGFCGSGMTGVAAQLCGDRKAVQELGYTVDEAGNIFDGGQRISRLGARKAVLNDLSPAATFIAYNYNTPVDVTAFEREAKRILDEVEAELGWMYETWHPHCDDPKRVKGKVNYTIWSDVFLCPNCGGEIVFWDVAVDEVNAKIREHFACNHCFATHTKRTIERAVQPFFDNVQQRVITRSKQAPVLINYSVGQRRYEKRPDVVDLERYNRIDKTQAQSWFPVTRIDRDIDIWYERDYRQLGVYSIDAFHTSSSRAVLSAFRHRAVSHADHRTRTYLLWVLTSVLEGSSRMNRERPGGMPSKLSGTLYIGALIREINCIDFLGRKASKFSSLMARTSGSTLSTQSCSSVAQIVDCSIDYIFIDPPFGSNIIYSDLSIIWESWLQAFTNPDAEAVIHRRKRDGHSLVDYLRIMSTAFLDVHRILKPGRWMTVEFHNTQNSVWRAIQEALGRAGFILADVRILDKINGSFKQVTAQGAAKQDLILSSYRPNTNFEATFEVTAGTATGVWAFTRQHLAQLPIVVRQDVTLETVAERQNYLLFDRMVAYHIQRGVAVPMGAAQFYAGLKQHFLERDGMYFLPDQVAAYDKARMEVEAVAQIALFVNDEKSAITWLRIQLNEAPQTFQEIQPRFLRELHQARHEDLPDLRVLLEQNFLQDSAGRYYVPDPANAEDLEKLRLRSLLQEFGQYRQSRKRLKVFRTEAVRAGFAQAYADNDFAAIREVAALLPEGVVQEDPELLMYLDAASLRGD